MNRFFREILEFEGGGDVLEFLYMGVRIFKVQTMECR